MNASIKAIAGVYALLGVAGALLWLYAVFFIGDPTYGILNGPWCLGLAYGLVTFRPWARTLGLVTSGLLGAVGVYVLFGWWQVLVRGGHAQNLTVAGGTVAALFVIALLIAFPAWQCWVFSRPQVRHLYSSKSA